MTRSLTRFKHYQKRIVSIIEKGAIHRGTPSMIYIVWSHLPLVYEQDEELCPGLSRHSSYPVDLQTQAVCTSSFPSLL